MEKTRYNLWKLMHLAKHNAVCLQRYTRRMRARYRIWDRVVPIILVVGVVISIIATDILSICSGRWIAIAAALLAAVASTLKDFSPEVVGLQRKKEVKRADELNAYYELLLVKCDALLYRLDNGMESEKKVIEVIEELRNDEIENGVTVNKIIRRLSKRENDIVETICSEYLSKTFNLNNGKISKA